MKYIVNIIIATGLSISLLQAQTTISTPPKNDGWFKIRVVQTGKYISVENASKENGARIIQWDYEGKNHQKFQAKKNEDGTYSFFSAHSGKSICADKGDNREGDFIIQNTLSQYFGKWHLAWLSNCGQGWKMQYKSGSGRPLQVTGANSCQLIEPQYHDGEVDCPYIYLFEPVDAPPLKQEMIKSNKIPDPAVIKKNQN